MNLVVDLVIQWQTTADKKSLLKSLPSSASVNFASNGAASADVEIDIHDSQTFQTVFGFGASLSTFPNQHLFE